jgi:hypothetical protein
VLETTLAGAFVKTIDMPFCRTALNGCRGFSDVFAPGTDGSRRRLYLTDREVDNDVDPAENDGSCIRSSSWTSPRRHAWPGLDPASSQCRSLSLR